MSEQLRRESIRRAVRSFLNDRIGTALRAESIQREVSKEWATDLNEIKSTLCYLTTTDPKQVEAIPDSDGATLYYRITAAGVKAHERSM